MPFESRFTRWDFAKLAYAVGVMAWVVLDWDSYYAACSAISLAIIGAISWAAHLATPVVVWVGRSYIQMWR